MTSGPIVIIDADTDSTKFYADVIKGIGVPNNIITFTACEPALDYLYTTEDKPFIIFSEIQLEEMSGLELKSIIQRDSYLKEKAIPFVFVTTDTSEETIRKAHQLHVQGYFEKPKYQVYVEQMLIKIFEYWELCKHINMT